MCKGISILRQRINQELLDELHMQRQLQRRLFAPAEDAEEELQFMFTDPAPRLPVIQDGQMRIVDWGNRNGDAPGLEHYKTGWCRIESLEAGKWRWLAPEEVAIPANYGHDKGRKFFIEQGIRGIVVHDKQEKPHVYMLTQASSHVYEVMTGGHDRMPVLIEQVI